jgi:peptidoglycan/LPS O-acetylase OafA/YrhL
VTPGRLLPLDGLRLLCCLAVVVGHAAWGPILGRAAGLGVDLFFALSGFLITRLLLAERERTGRIDLRHFYERRARRILPLYYATVGAAYGLTALLGDRFAIPFGGPNDERFFTTTLLAHLALVPNLIEAPVPSPLDVLWSIGVEEQFYLLFPLALRASRGPRPVLRLVAVGLVICWSVRAYLASLGDAGLYRNPLAHGDGLLLGALAAQIEASSPAALAWVRRRAWLIELSVTGLLTLHVVFRTSSVTPTAYLLSFLASAVLSASLVLTLACGAGPLARALTHLAPAGKLTYAGYLVHKYAIGAAYLLARVLAVPESLLDPVRLVTSCLFTLALGWAAHRLIERPFLRRTTA